MKTISNQYYIFKCEVCNKIKSKTKLQHENEVTTKQNICNKCLIEMELKENER